MRASHAGELAEILGTVVAAGDSGARISGVVSTDTRKLSEFCLFIALRGENFDGDEFASDALQGAASVVVVRRWQGDVPDGKAVILVEDTLLALQKLAHWWRQQLDLPIVCITGSNGKTSTKDLTSSVLSQRFQVSSTQGNFNNHIGLPLTVLATEKTHFAAVWEIGMNHAGELLPLCQIAQPKYGIITNIGTAHIEFLGSRDAIAEEKSTLARALPEAGWLAVPAACDYYDYIRQRTRASVVAVGNGRGSVRAESLRSKADGTDFELVIDGLGRTEVSLPVAGQHMVVNAMLAASIGWKLGLSLEEIAAGLSQTSISGGRLRQFEWSGILVLDDTYNANPESMVAAIDTLASIPVADGGTRYAVLGRMGELGIHASSAHLKTGAYARQAGVEVIAAGEGAGEIAEGAGGVPHLIDLAEAGKWLSSHVRPGDVVLFKGSRTAAIETAMHTAFPIN